MSRALAMGARGRRALMGLVVGGLLGSALLWQDRGSLERGNRLYRAGDTIAAAALYRERADASTGSPGAAYNLGTALLALDPDEAGARLEVATTGDDPGATQRSRYNLGYRSLTAVGRSAEPDSIVVLLSDAIGHNRAALRLDPADENARWNLALAQRMLDSLFRVDEELYRRNQAGEDETEIDLNTLVRSEMGDGVSGPEPDQPHAAESQGERRGTMQGASEAWTMQDPGPLSEAEAMQLLSGVVDPAERMIRGILWSLRPDVAWWASEASPGGSW